MTASVFSCLSRPVSCILFNDIGCNIFGALNVVLIVLTGSEDAMKRVLRIVLLVCFAARLCGAKEMRSADPLDAPDFNRFMKGLNYQIFNFTINVIFVEIIDERERTLH
jgi:hypothetical protein